MRDDQVRRYARHVLLPDVGGVGQKRLFAAQAVVRDASGAGAVAITYLAAAGVGTIVVEDEGLVAPADVGALYESGDVGVARREAARLRVRALNPDVRVAARADGAAAPIETEDAGAGPPPQVGQGAERPLQRTSQLLAGARAAGAFIVRVARG